MIPLPPLYSQKTLPTKKFWPHLPLDVPLSPLHEGRGTSLSPSSVLTSFDVDSTDLRSCPETGVCRPLRCVCGLRCHRTLLLWTCYSYIVVVPLDFRREVKREIKDVRSTSDSEGLISTSDFPSKEGWLGSLLSNLKRCGIFRPPNTPSFLKRTWEYPNHEPRKG